MTRQLSRSSIAIVIITAAVAAALSLLSYQYSTAAADQIVKLASHEVRSNTEIQARDLAAILANKVESISTNLQLISDATTVQNHDVQDAAALFTSARKSTGDFASSYFWVDKDGKLLWADSFTNKTIEQQYNGGDRSYRDYYSKPRDTLVPYYSTVIESVDNVSRLYIGYPILGIGANTGIGVSGNDTGTFEGVVVAAINLDTLGKYVKNQLQTNSASSVGLLDRNGLILYSSSTPQYIGKNIFEPEIQNLIPSDIKEPFNEFVRDSLTGKSGSGDFSSQGTTSTIAYDPVTVSGNEFAVFYSVTPHQLAGSAVILIEQQRALNASIIVAIGAVATVTGTLVLVWNRRLEDVAAIRTSELKFANDSLADSNKQMQAANVNLQEVNKQLAEANEQLKIHEKMQNEFINVAAHELRTPVQPLLGIAEQLELDLGDGVEDIKISRSEIEMLARNAKRLSRLSSDILEVSRIESNSMKLSKEKVDLKNKIKTVIDDTKTFIEDGKKLEVVFESAFQGPAIIDADKPRLFEVLSNLIRNAIKFTKEGTIKVKLEKKDGQAVISVKDTGRGVDPDMFRKLFTKFGTKSETGTGLGLYISKNIVEAHGGEIWAENNPDGKGATFTFTLPMQEENENKGPTMLSDRDAR